MSSPWTDMLKPFGLFVAAVLAGAPIAFIGKWLIDCDWPVAAVAIVSIFGCVVVACVLVVTFLMVMGVA